MNKICRMIASIMLVIAIVFIIFALNHPESAFPWSNTVTYTIYGLYVIVMIILFIVSFNRKSK